MKIITNNPRVKTGFEQLEISFIDESYLDVLVKVQEEIINKKYRLLSHPLSGSIKPNETYYKSIMLEDKIYLEIDLTSLEYIESAIEVYKKFIACKQRPNWTKKILDDFAIVDFYLIKSAIDSANIG